MWFFGKKKTSPVSFTDTLSGEKKPFKPLKAGKALLYSCGPTVYGPVQIGNLRSFVLADLVGRTLSVAGYEVKRIMNITDVGHLVADADQGEDKMAVGAKRDNTTPEAIADKYTNVFLRDIEALGIDTKKITFPRATSYIKEDIAMIRKLEQKGYTYKTSAGLYFDTTKFPSYGSLLGMKDAELRAGTRVDMGEKKSPHDFVLWRAAKAGDLQKWNSPWGVGNPGWSIECSAMATALLGEQIDVHTGGEDLASVHHNNEIAQSEGASGKHPYVGTWVHGAFLTMNGEKLSKSAGNSLTLDEIKEHRHPRSGQITHPLALRFLFLQAHYRSPLSFSWDAVDAAQMGLKDLWKNARLYKERSHGNAITTEKVTELVEPILQAVYDDLRTPHALALFFGILSTKDITGESPLKLTPQEMWRVIELGDSIFGLSLTNPPEEQSALDLSDLPSEAKTVAEAREEARKNRDFATSDELRQKLKTLEYTVEDAAEGPRYTQI